MDAPAILAALRAVAVPEKAAEMAAYMKNRFTFLGVATPVRRQTGKPYFRADKARAVDWAFIDTCWNSPYREMHYIATDYLRTKQAQLTAADLPRLQALIVRNAWWDSVDAFIRPLGDILCRYPQARAQIEAMSRADDYWLRRAAITAQLLAKDATDTALLATVINNNLNQREILHQQGHRLGTAPVQQNGRRLGAALHRHPPGRLERTQPPRSGQISGLTQPQSVAARRAALPLPTRSTLPSCW